MQLNQVLIAGYVLAVLSLLVSGMTVTMNTCEACPAPRPSHVIERFRACKLISLRSALEAGLEIITDLKRELVTNYHIREDELSARVDRSNYISVNEIMSMTYAKVQQILLEERFVGHFNTMFSLHLNTGSLSNHLQRCLCRLLPVLRHGHLYRARISPQCHVTESLVVRRRTEAINVVVNFVTVARYDIELIIESINDILAPSRIQTL